jgi:hypothetical protein
MLVAVFVAFRCQPLRCCSAPVSGEGPGGAVLPRRWRALPRLEKVPRAEAGRWGWVPGGER